MPTLLVCGGRNFANRHMVRHYLDAILLPQPLTDDPATWFPAQGISLVHGACPTGADALADAWAVANFCPVERFPIDHALDGPWPGCGPRRNARMWMQARPSAALAFPGGNGTRNMMMLAGARGFPAVPQNVERIRALLFGSAS